MDCAWDLDLHLASSFWIRFYADLQPQETLNYWKQLPHILKYFRAEEDPNARRPQNFMNGFLEVGSCCLAPVSIVLLTPSPGQELSVHRRFIALYISQ